MIGCDFSLMLGLPVLGFICLIGWVFMFDTDDLLFVYLYVAWASVGWLWRCLGFSLPACFVSG